MRALLACVLAGALSSCSFAMEWERVEAGSSVVQEDGYSLQLPVGWARSGGWLTRDGGHLQAIAFARRERGKPLPEDRELDPYTPDFLDRLAAGLQQDEGVRAVECTEVTLAGRRAMRARFERQVPPCASLADLFSSALFPLDTWWRYELDWVQVEDGDVFFFLYGAPQLVYFERDLATFERVVASLASDPSPADKGSPRLPSL